MTEFIIPKLFRELTILPKRDVEVPVIRPQKTMKLPSWSIFDPDTWLFMGGRRRNKDPQLTFVTLMTFLQHSCASVHNSKKEVDPAKTSILRTGSGNWDQVHREFHSVTKENWNHKISGNGWKRKSLCLAKSTRLWKKNYPILCIVQMRFIFLCVYIGIYDIPINI